QPAQPRLAAGLVRRRRQAGLPPGRRWPHRDHELPPVRQRHRPDARARAAGSLRLVRGHLPVTGLTSLSVNLEYMFQEAGDDLASRVRAASAAGFSKAEMFWTHDKDLDAIAAALDETGIQLWTVLVDPRTTKLVDKDTH